MERTSFSTHDYAFLLVGALQRIKLAETVKQRAVFVADFQHLRDDFWIGNDFVYPIIDFREAA